MEPPMSSRRCWRGLATLILTFTLIVLWSGTAAAHTQLAASTPGDGQTVGTPPTQLELVFTDALVPEFVRVVVSGPGGGNPGLNNLPKPEVADMTVRQPLPTPLTAGSYVVGYRVVASDGHPLSGQIRFTYTPGAPASTPSAAIPSRAAGTAGQRSESDRAGSWATWGWLAGALLVVAAAVVAGRGRRAR
jgi:hypothetical protein